MMEKTALKSNERKAARILHSDSKRPRKMGESKSYDEKETAESETEKVKPKTVSKGKKVCEDEDDDDDDDEALIKFSNNPQ
jgi:hypothetical protein